MSLFGAFLAVLITKCLICNLLAKKALMLYNGYRKEFQARLFNCLRHFGLMPI